MTEIDAALRELRSTLLSIKFFDVALRTLVMMTACLVVTTYIGWPWWYGAIPTCIFLIIMTYLRVNVRSYHEVEDKVPQLREALTTAADTRKQSGTLVRELQEEVLHKMHAIKSSYFIGFGSTTRQLLLLTGLAFIAIGLAAFNVNFATTKEFALNQAVIKNAFDSIINTTDAEEAVNAKLKQKKQDNGMLKYVKLKNNGSLFGNENLIDLGSDPLELSIDPQMTGSNLLDPREAEEKKFAEQQAGSIGASAQGACSTECDIPKESQDIVKTYFEKVGETS
jgi:hypothetical protein